MYDNKTIEDVLKYLYEQKQEKLAKVVLDLIKQNERTSSPIYPLAPISPNIWYGDNTNPLNPPYKITCEVGKPS